MGAVTPLAIPISPESGPESSAPLLPSLDDLPTLREMLGLPDRVMIEVLVLFVEQLLRCSKFDAYLLYV